jgi:RNA polymerase sigma-70 factor (ECF subfamily)
MYDYSNEAVRAAAAREFQARRHFLWGLCYRMTGSTADADDLVQETFARAVERPPSDLQTGWPARLSRVATMLSLDALRNRKRREYVGPWLPAPMETGDEASPPDAAAAHDASGAPRYDAIESVSVAFLLALESLTPRERALLLLRDVFGYSAHEAALSLDLTQSHAKVTHHRAEEGMKGYDAVRQPPTRDRQAKTAERLQQFLTCVQAQDGAAVEAMLARDACALADGAGEYHTPRTAIVGRKNVARLLIGAAARRAGEARFSFRMLNGLPALVAESPVPQGYASRFTLQIELDRDGAIAAVHAVLAARKLRAVRFDS